MSDVQPKLTSSFLKKTLKVIFVFFAVCLTLLIMMVSLVLWLPQTAHTALPYLERLTDGQLQVESAEGQLVNGLTLNNVRFNTPTVTLHIDQVAWQWQLSALFNRHLHFQEINITKPTVKRVRSDTATEPTTEPFALLMQLDTYHIRFDVDQLKLTQASLQQDNEPPINITQFSSAIHWQERTLKLQNVSGDYQAYQLQANSRFEVLNQSEFKAEVDLALSGLQGIESLKAATEATGGLQQIRFTLEVIEPYTVRSEHILKMDEFSIQLNSQFKQLTAKINEQWQINQLQGHNSFRFDLNNKTLVSQGKLNIALKDKPLTELEYSAEYAQSGETTFNLTTQFKEMGRVKVQGQANLHNVQKLTATASVQTEQFNLQWLDPSLNYQINSLFDFTLSDVQTLTSQLAIQQFNVTGLPEAFAFKGKVTTQLNSQTKTNTSDYKVDIQSGQLDYASYSGKLKAQLFVKPDLSRIDIPSANLVLGDNSIELSGQWAETLRFSLSAQLNQLHQLYAPLSGKISAQVNANGRLLNDFSGVKQGWSTLKINAKNLRYQIPDSLNQTTTLSLKQLTLNAKVPLHQLEWTTFAVSATEVVQNSNNADSRILFSKLHAARQASEKGLITEVTVQHPDLSFKTELYEAKPSLDQINIALRRFDIKQPNTGNWQLVQSSDIHWHPPLQIKTQEICLKSVDNAEAKLCLQAQNDQVKWAMNELPVFDWLKPWLGDHVLLKGHLKGSGSANWKNQLTLQQTLLIPQLDVTVIEQGYKIPFAVKNWQTDLHITPTKASLKSLGQINKTGQLNAEIHADNKNQQAWSSAKLNGNVRLNLTEWPVSGQLLELIALNKTDLTIETTLSGTANALQHDTQADIDLNLNLPLLGLSHQAIQLKAQVTPQTIDAKGVWKQQENQADERQANLTLKLTELNTQPNLLAHFNTNAIELLKTPFAHLTTSADMTVTFADGATHILGQAQLHDSALNLDEMPLHQQTSTSRDEIIMDEQGQVVAKENADSNLSYDIKVGFGKNVKVDVQDSQLFLGGELQLVQTKEVPEMKLFGKLKLREGYINLDAHNQVLVDESSFLFNGVMGNPTLNVNLYRVVDQTTARLNITGNATQPQFVFYSTPALSQARVVNLMVFGRAGDMSKEPNYESQVLSAFYKLGIQNNTPVLNTLTSALGIQDVYFDVQDQQVSRLLVGRSLTDKLYVRYAKDLTGQQNNAVQFFYQLTNKWLLKTNSGDNNSSVDLIYRLER